jgi:hypothetical protein
MVESEVAETLLREDVEWGLHRQSIQAAVDGAKGPRL